MKIFKKLIQTPEHNPYNSKPRKFKYATKRDIEWMGDAGKARPIWGCLIFLFIIAFVVYEVYWLITNW